MSLKKFKKYLSQKNKVVILKFSFALNFFFQFFFAEQFLCKVRVCSAVALEKEGKESLCSHSGFTSFKSEEVEKNHPVFHTRLQFQDMEKVASLQNLDNVSLSGTKKWIEGVTQGN